MRHIPEREENERVINIGSRKSFYKFLPLAILAGIPLVSKDDDDDGGEWDKERIIMQITTISIPLQPDNGNKFAIFNSSAFSYTSGSSFRPPPPVLLRIGNLLSPHENCGASHSRCCLRRYQYPPSHTT